MSIDWNTYEYRCSTHRCGSYKTRLKYWNIDFDEKRACIPMLIWNDGHREWSRWYWFKDEHEHQIRGKYINFK